MADAVLASTVRRQASRALSVQLRAVAKFMPTGAVGGSLGNKVRVPAPVPVSEIRIMNMNLLWSW